MCVTKHCSCIFIYIYLSHSKVYWLLLLVYLFIDPQLAMKYLRHKFQTVCLKCSRIRVNLRMHLITSSKYDAYYSQTLIMNDSQSQKNEIYHDNVRMEELLLQKYILLQFYIACYMAIAALKTYYIYSYLIVNIIYVLQQVKMHIYMNDHVNCIIHAFWDMSVYSFMWGV